MSGRVCLVCDKFLSKSETCTVSLKAFLKRVPYLQGDPCIPQSLRREYIFSMPDHHPANDMLKQCLLSPRSSIVYEDPQKRTPKVICCAECRSGLDLRAFAKGKLPRHAIANGLTIGTAPPCLQRLNEVELALLSQARCRGHLFSYWGGCHRSIKGWHSFYEVNPSYTTTVLGRVGELTASNNIAVVLCGPFTPAQKEKVLKKVHVNIQHVMEAFEWLKANNRLYADLPVPSITAPIIIDNSEAASSQNSDIETKEEIKVVFPDGSINTGGCSNGEDFEKTLADIRAMCDLPYHFLLPDPQTESYVIMRTRTL
jgi:hypothetical protein